MPRRLHLVAGESAPDAVHSAGALLLVRAQVLAGRTPVAGAEVLFDILGRDRPYVYRARSRPDGWASIVLSGPAFTSADHSVLVFEARLASDTRVRVTGTRTFVRDLAVNREQWTAYQARPGDVHPAATELVETGVQFTETLLRDQQRAFPCFLRAPADDGTRTGVVLGASDTIDVRRATPAARESLLTGADVWALMTPAESTVTDVVDVTFDVLLFEFGIPGAAVAPRFACYFDGLDNDGRLIRTGETAFIGTTERLV